MMVSELHYTRMCLGDRASSQNNTLEVSRGYQTHGSVCNASHRPSPSLVVFEWVPESLFVLA